MLFSRYHHYFPGAEPICDTCKNQVKDKEELYCSVLPWKETILDWQCMKRKVEEESCPSQSSQ